MNPEHSNRMIGFRAAADFLPGLTRAFSRSFLSHIQLRCYVVTQCTRAHTTNDPLRTMGWSNAGANHLGKQIYIIIHFSRHLLANGVQHFQKFWPAIHNDFRFLDYTFNQKLRIRKGKST